ncbi:hypothetical protein [Qipengyuania sp. ASV99]|uniref:hypothetical protein n=1 Tax=Qipengyuania sp. ASV99 TaxID=3399681 RepID=UPI003A4C775B
MIKTIRTISLTSAAAAFAFSAFPAQAQLGGMFRDAQRGAQAAEGCEKGSSGDTARGVIGGLLSGAAGRTAQRAGLGQFVPLSEFTDQISKEIACKLDPEEQKQAADATLEATRSIDEDGTGGPPVGQTAAWTSDTRRNVSGTSTVTARDASSGDNDCITVTDVIIVEGEETRADKRMCRLAGSPRYTIVA